MTVQTNNNSISYVGNGSTAHFDYDYLILDASHLKVYFGDVLQTSGYVVSGVSSQTGGTVAFAVAPPNGTNITLIRDVPFLQLTDYQPYDAFPAESHERALDLLTMMAQQLKDELGRTMQYPVGGDKWDARGNEIINVGTGGSGTSATNVDQVKYLIASEVGDDPSASASARSREALRRSYAEAGFNLVTGSFEAGGTLVNANDVLLQESTGKAYSGAGPFPQAVAAGTNPVGDANWIPQADSKIRNDLTNTTNAVLGDAMLGVKSTLTGGFARTQHDKNSDWVSVLDFGATWDGTSHLLSERYSTLGEAKVVYPFVTALTQTLDYAALQAACNTKKTVLLPKGFARVNATVVLNNSVRIQGEGTDNINRAQTYISVDGNIALFTNKQGTASVTEMIQVHIDGLYVFYNPGTTPTTAAGNSAKIAFDFKSTIPGSSGLEMSSISNCTVHGGWAAISDTSGTYLTKWTNVWARNCRRGFAKALGTTILLDSCYTMGCVTPYEFGAVMSVTMINCAMDTSSISTSGEGTGYSGLFFDNTHSINIMGFDAEGNTVTTNGGDIASLFHFKNSNAKLSGLTGISTTLKTVAPSAAGSVAFIRTSGTSQVVIDASEDGLNATSDIAYVGSGGYAITVLAQDTSRVMAQGSKFRAPVGGTPALAPLSQGAVSWSNCLITGQVVTGYIQETSAQGLQTPCFFTARGIAALPAGASTPMFALPNSPGAYMITVWGSSSGANYFTVYLATFDGTGTATLTVLKPAAFLTLQSSGLSISATATGGANFNWTYTKLG